VAIASVNPTDGKPSTRYPPSMLIGFNSLILILGNKLDLILNTMNNSLS